MAKRSYVILVWDFGYYDSTSGKVPGGEARFVGKTKRKVNQRYNEWSDEMYRSGIRILSHSYDEYRHGTIYGQHSDPGRL